MRPPPPSDSTRRTVAEAEVVAMLGLYGWALDPDPGGAAPARLLHRRVAAGLPCVVAGGDRLFDPAEAVNHVIAAGLAGEEPDWRERFVTTARRLARTVDPTTPADGALPPRAYRVRFTRHFDLRGHQGRVRLRLPAPVADRLILATDDDFAGTAVQTAGRIEWTITGSVPPAATIGFIARFVSRPGADDPRPLSSEQRERWLAPAEGLVQVTPRVRSLAARLAGTLREDRAIVAAVYGHLLDYFCCGIIAYEAITGAATDHVLAGGWYDCQLGAALLVALCRARGIPARIVGGYLLAPAAPTPHFWCEAWIDAAGDRAPGWLPFDLLGWDLSAGGRDAEWRNVFAGRIDHRMTTQILPDTFTGVTAPSLPVAHHRIATRADDGDGVMIDHVRLDGRRVYQDRITVLPVR